MGRLKETLRLRASHGLTERPFLLFALLMLLPALAFGALGYRSLEREIAAQRREAASESRDIVRRGVERAARDLEELADREGERPYTVYQLQYAPEETVFKQLDFQPSPLTKRSDDPRIRGWFQWELGAKGVFDHPDTFGPGSEAWRDTFTETYGPTLRRRLAGAPTTFDATAARLVEHPLRVVQANEERGQLMEEIQIARNIAERQGAKQAADAPTRPEATLYLQSFFERTSDAPVPVRYGRFRYVARRAGQPGPPLVAWRIVWIPAAFLEQREVTRDRWLLQGYALDPGAVLPVAWESVGAARTIRADLAPLAATLPLPAKPRSSMRWTRSSCARPTSRPAPTLGSRSSRCPTPRRSTPSPTTRGCVSCGCSPACSP